MGFFREGLLLKLAGRFPADLSSWFQVEGCDLVFSGFIEGNSWVDRLILLFGGIDFQNSEEILSGGFHTN